MLKYFVVVLLLVVGAGFYHSHEVAYWEEEIAAEQRWVEQFKEWFPDLHDPILNIEVRAVLEYWKAEAENDLARIRVVQIIVGLSFAGYCFYRAVKA